MKMIAAGWYSDPAGPGERYWDGNQWTSHTQADVPRQASGASVHSTPHLIWGGALFIALGSLAAWAHGITSLDSNVQWPITADLFPHGYLFLALSAIGLVLFFRLPDKTSIDTMWTFALLTLIIVGTDAMFVVVKLNSDFQSLGAGLFLTLGGAVALFTGASLMRSEAGQPPFVEASKDRPTTN
jgi:Protein of unknown function (DUF2510)